MSLLTNFNRVGFSRNQIDIKKFSHNYYELGSGEIRAVLDINSINFELKSESEQDMILMTYLNFINALPCPIQILVRVRSLDIEKYLENFKLKQNETLNNGLNVDSYCSFIQDQLKTNKLLTRKFYIVVSSLSKDLDTLIQQLDQNCEIISKNLNKLGLQASRLSALELIDLFYSYFNPEKSKIQTVSDLTLDLLEKANYI